MDRVVEFGEFGGEVFGGTDHQVLSGAHTVFELLSGDREAGSARVFGAQEVAARAEQVQGGEVLIHPKRWTGLVLRQLLTGPCGSTS